MGKLLKTVLFSILISITFCNYAFARVDEGGGGAIYENINAEVVSSDKTKKIVTVEYPVLVSGEEDGTENWVVKKVAIPYSFFTTAGIDEPENLNKGDDINFKVDSAGTVISVGGIEWTDTSASRNTGFQLANGGTIWETKYVYNRLFKTYCKADQALECWTGKVFSWSQTAILILATTVMVGAGIIYMVSAGDPKRIALSKKFMFGALSGVAVIVLGRFFLTKVVGVPWL